MEGFKEDSFNPVAAAAFSCEYRLLLFLGYVDLDGVLLRT